MPRGQRGNGCRLVKNVRSVVEKNPVKSCVNGIKTLKLKSFLHECQRRKQRPALLN